MSTDIGITLDILLYQYIHIMIIMIIIHEIVAK